MKVTVWDSLLASINARFSAEPYSSPRMSGPASEEAIQLVEAELQLRFPADYREFLRAYGALEIQGSEIFGIWTSNPKSLADGTVLGETMTLRAAGLPSQFIAIRPMGYDQRLVLDTEASEGARLQFYDPEDQAFYPFDEAEDFTAYFADFLQRYLEPK